MQETQSNSKDSIMEDYERKSRQDGRQEEAFSKIVKAGRRVYYIDVKRSRNEEMYVAITESKRVSTGFGDDGPASYEKHKIFIYPEDFDKMKEGIAEAIDFVEKRQGKAERRKDEEGDGFKVDTDF